MYSAIMLFKTDLIRTYWGTESHTSLCTYKAEFKVLPGNMSLEYLLSSECFLTAH